MMASVVYALCALTSIVCAVLLLRAYVENRARLLLFSSLCFTGLAINNVLLFVDLVVVPAADLALYRDLSAAVAIMVLMFGLIWHAR
jgi:Family of unknown function (DUF5985)